MSRHEKTCLIRGDGGRAIRGILARMSDKWALVVVTALYNHGMRFTQLQEDIPGISQRMLTLTLRHLERDGLITRTVYPEVPPRVEYELTAMGQTLIQATVTLAEWAVQHNPEIERSRTAYDARQLRKHPGHRTDPAASPGGR